MINTYRIVYLITYLSLSMCTFSGLAYSRAKDFCATALGSAVGASIGTVVGNVLSQPAHVQERVVIVHHVDRDDQFRRLKQQEQELKEDIAHMRAKRKALIRELRLLDLSLEEKESTLRHVRVDQDRYLERESDAL